MSTHEYLDPKRHIRFGISMPEILTVIVIIGVVSSLAVPRFMRFTSTSRLEESEQMLAKDMEWAKLAGTKSGTRHYLRFVPGSDTSWYELWMENSNPVDNLFSIADDSLIRRVALDPAVQFAVPSTATVAAPNAPGGSLPTNGMGDGVASENCRDDGLVPGQGSWSSVVAFCGGSKAAMEAGAVYLSLKTYPDLGEAIVFDDNVSFKMLKYAWRGGWAAR